MRDGFDSDGLCLRTTSLAASTSCGPLMLVQLVVVTMSVQQKRSCGGPHPNSIGHELAYAGADRG